MDSGSGEASEEMIKHVSVGLTIHEMCTLKTMIRVRIIQLLKILSDIHNYTSNFKNFPFLPNNLCLSVGTNGFRDL